MLLPVQKQMEIILENRLPATWLLQFDALVSGPFVKFLKDHMAKSHEVGFWFEMNEKHCRAAGVEWRGRPGYEWDYNPSVAFTIGYTPEERIKLADTAMSRFKAIWGRYPSSVASWNLDAIVMAHLDSRYRVDAFAVCRDQIATDGFTIWGAPIAGYYPSKTNCWSPALDRKNQISSPVFRMLGQDPVYYYEKEWTIPGGRKLREPDTMEPVWTSGRSPDFVRSFLKMIEEAPTLKFGYAQMGQENSFPWTQQEAGYAPQMKALAALRDLGGVHVETMGESGRRFKRAFATTPAQAQVQLTDPFGNSPRETTVWYQSRSYRANLHFKGDLPYLRDLTVYSDHFSQPFLEKATRDHDVEQRMPAIMDGYHWRGPAGAGGYFKEGDQLLWLSGKPVIREEGDTLVLELPVHVPEGLGALTSDVRLLTVRFEDRRITASLSAGRLTMAFEWDPSKARVASVEPTRVSYSFRGFPYSVGIAGGEARAISKGWAVTGERISLSLAQRS